MGLIVVCPSTYGPEIAAERRPSRIVALAAPDADMADGGGISSLALRFHDIAETRPGLRPPTQQDVEALLAFGADWDEAQPMLIHCQMGISRSTASAFAIACARRPDTPERGIADDLRRLAPCATPNGLIVAMADDVLGREGRMVAAIRAIGRGADYRPYRSFDLPLTGRPYRS